MINPVLLDTSIISHYLHREAESRYPSLVARVDQIAAEQRLALSVVTLYELRRGLLRLEKANSGTRKRASFELFLQTFDKLAFNAPAAEIAAELHARGATLKPAVKIKDADLLIAATAAAHGHRLLTSDGKLIERLKQVHPNFPADLQALE